LSDTAGQVAAKIGLSLEGLTRDFAAFGLENVCEDNGLTREENLDLFEMTGIKTALRLIYGGARRKGLVS